MNQKIVKIIKKIPPVLYPAKFVYYNLFMPFIYFKNLLIDPSYIKNNFYYKTLKDMQLRKNISLFLDRQSEVKEFFGVDNIYLLKYYLKNGFPNTPKFRKRLLSFFKKTDNNEELRKSYEESSFHYVVRLLLGYERYSLIIPYLDFIIENSKKPIKVLDYGCGISDVALLFASLGADVTIAELDNKKFDFSIWRFKKRDLNCKVIKINDLSEYPRLLVSEYDLVIALELFEHVRDPLKLLKNLTNALKSGGFLLDSSKGYIEREVGGDHLKEAIEIGQSEDYVKYFKSEYISPRGDLSFLFKKV